MSDLPHHRKLPYLPQRSPLDGDDIVGAITKAVDQQVGSSPSLANQESTRPIVANEPPPSLTYTHPHPSEMLSNKNAEMPTLTSIQSIPQNETSLSSSPLPDTSYSSATSTQSSPPRPPTRDFTSSMLAILRPSTAASHSPLPSQPPPPASQDFDTFSQSVLDPKKQATLKVLRKKLTVERMVKEGAANMLKNLTDSAAVSVCENNLRESQKRLDYLESAVSNLIGITQPSASNPRLSDPSISAYLRELHPDDNDSTISSVFSAKTAKTSLSQSGDFGGTNHALSQVSISAPPINNGVTLTRSRSLSSRRLSFFFWGKSQSSHSAIHSAQSLSEDPAAELEFKSNFDYLKNESPISPEKIVYKRQHLEIRSNILQKLKSGLLGALSAMKDSISEKRKAEVTRKLEETKRKLALITKSLGLLTSLESTPTDGPPPETDSELESHVPTNSSAPEIKKKFHAPLNGKFTIQILSIGGYSKISSASETQVVIRVDGNDMIRARAVNEKWHDDFIIAVEKGQDIEVAFYEGDDVLVSFVWFKLWELEENLWFYQDKSASRQKSYLSLKTFSGQTDVDNVPGGARQTYNSDGIICTLEMEPEGFMKCALNFVPDVSPPNTSKGIVRAGAVKKAIPMLNHKMQPVSFYQVVKCSVCQDFLISGRAYQCQFCCFTAHKRCVPFISYYCNEKHKGMDYESPQEEHIEHQVPHHFEPYANFTASWCCHCGFMLSLGKKNSLRCTDCYQQCHKNCARCIPYRCGFADVTLPSRKSLQSRSSGTLDKLLSAVSAKTSPAVSNDKAISLYQFDLPTPSSATRNISSPSLGDISQAEDGIASHYQTSAPIRHIGLNNFTFLAVIGKGNFGKVMLAEDIKTKNLYAIKVLKKEFILKNDEVESTKAEKRVFLRTNRDNHPFLVHLHSSFQTESRLYFVMEYVSGGDLMWHIQHSKFTESRARFYANEILLAIEYFHSQNIVYRDLKLDNILLSSTGHIKIADYGLCREGMNHTKTTRTFCGTPEFMAPEIVAEQPYTRAVDWWAYGVLLYEMFLGRAPFKGEDEEAIFKSILTEEPSFPANMPKDAEFLIRALLKKNPERRLGSGTEDSAAVKAHPFFKDVDFSCVYHQAYIPPFVPRVNSPTDVSNFDREFTREIPLLTPCFSVLGAAQQEEFRGFTYISEWAQAAAAQADAAVTEVPGSPASYGH